MHEAVLIVPAADVKAEGHAGVIADDRIVFLDARIHELVGMATPLAVSAQLRMKKLRGRGGIWTLSSKVVVQQASTVVSPTVISRTLTASRGRL